MCYVCMVLSFSCHNDIILLIDLEKNIKNRNDVLNHPIFYEHHPLFMLYCDYILGYKRSVTVSFYLFLY